MATTSIEVHFPILDVNQFFIKLSGTEHAINRKALKDCRQKSPFSQNKGVKKIVIMLKGQSPSLGTKVVESGFLIRGRHQRRSLRNRYIYIYI